MLREAGLLVLALFAMLFVMFCSTSRAQVIYTNYTFDTSASGWGVWPNGTGQFVSAQWNSSDVNNSPTSGSLLVTSTFTGASQQSYVWSGNSGSFSTPINGALVTNLSCYIRFDPSSPTNSSTDSYGTIEFYVVTSANDSTSIQLPNSSTYYHQTAGNTGWVLYSVPVSTGGNIYGIQIELQTYSDSLTGTSKMYIDDVQLNGQGLPGPVNGTSVMDWNNVHQRIDGFGASSAWLTISTLEGTLLYSTNNNITYTNSTSTNVCNGIGLSLLRNHIVFANTTSASATPTTGETLVMQQAQSYGARVWSTPWTPPTGFKNTNNLYGSQPITNAANGGTYLGSGGNITNVNYASQLANYVYSMKHTYGINLYAISIQNEPDAQVNTYEACQWNGSQIHDFATNLFNALSNAGVGSTKIILPESENWTDPDNLAGPSMTDPNVAADVGIVACHNYDGMYGPTSLTKNSYGKPLWETEVAILSGSDSSIANGVYYGQRIYQFMTQANANAYHYWWLVSGSSTSGNEGLLDNGGNITKRLFAFGQYSRFVRPNFYRIDATISQTPALVSAYKDSASPAFAIVVVNTNSLSDVIQTFNFTNFTATSVTPWVTSATLNLTPQSSVNVTNGSFTYDVPAQSIVTFVGQGITNSPPVFTTVPNPTVNPGVTVLVTNTATASDVPPYSLTYSEANIFPSGATLNSSSGVFSWRPSISQANTTNQIEVAATDSDSAGLSATNSFSVVVNSITNPVVSAGSGGGNVSFSQGQFSMTINGPQGPDYTLLMSTNLVNWQTIFTTDSPATPFAFTDPNATNANQYYEIQIGP